MLFFHNKRVFYSIDSVRSILPTNNEHIIIQINKEYARYFALFESIDDFITWYNKIPRYDKTLNEVILSDMRKLILDIDDSEDKDLGTSILKTINIKQHVTKRIVEVMHKFNIRPEILIFDMCTTYKISFHFVVANVAFSAQTCATLCSLIAANQKWKPLVDFQVYKKTQFMRIEGSTKYGQNRYKPLLDLKKSMLSYIVNIPHIDLQIPTLHAASPMTWIPVTDSPTPLSVGEVLASDKRNFHSHIYSSTLINPVIPSYFKIRKRVNNVLLLDRIRPAMCSQCKRVHTSENAAIIIINNKPIFRCWRAHTFGHNMSSINNYTK